MGSFLVDNQIIGLALFYQTQLAAGMFFHRIQPGFEIADFSKQNLKPPDAIMLASDLSQAVVTGALTEVR